MLYLLFVILLISSVLIIYLTNKDILSPSVIVTVMFTFVILVSILMSKQWNLVIAPITLITIVSGIFAFSLGELTYRYVSVKSLGRSGVKQYKKVVLKLPQKLNLLLIIFITIVSFIYFKRIYEMSIIAGNTYGVSQMLYYARILIIQQGISPGFILDQSFKIIQGIAYIYIFVIINNLKANSKKNIFIYILPVIGYLILAILSTSRTYFIQLFVYISVITFIFHYKENKNNTKRNFKIILNSLGIMIVFFTLFSLLGFLTGKTQLLGSFNGLAYYISSSIPAFDNYLNTIVPKSSYFGSETLINIYNLFSRIGLDVPTFKFALSSLPGDNISSNIYTALRRYIQDFGFLGMITIMFILGWLYSFLYLKVRRTSQFTIHVLIYATIVYPLIEMPIEERFFLDIVSISTIIRIITMLLIYNIYLKKQLNRGVYK